MGKRQMRRAQARKGQKQQKNRRDSSAKWMWGATVALMVAAGAILWFGRPESVGERVPVMADRTHIELGDEPIPYNSYPPTSGQHWYGTLSEYGEYPNTIAQVIQVHHLEHGEVIIHYHPELISASALDGLRRIVDDFSTGILLHPDPALEEPIVLTAWGRILRLESLDEPLIRRFIDRYRTLVHY